MAPEDQFPEVLPRLPIYTAKLLCTSMATKSEDIFLGWDPGRNPPGRPLRGGRNGVLGPLSLLPGEDLGRRDPQPRQDA
jgi:hypothetical protein